MDTLRRLRVRDGEIFTEILSNTDAGVRLFAAESLKQLTRGRRPLRLPESTIEKLRTLASNDDYFPVRNAARDTLRNIER